MALVRLGRPLSAQGARQRAAQSSLMPMRRLFKLLALWLLLATGAAHASTLTISSALSVNGGQHME